MSTVSRRDFLTVLGVAAADTQLFHTRIAYAAGVGEDISTVTSADPFVVRGNARFRVLSPTLVRMEYSPSAHFIDARSVAIWNAEWPTPKFTAKDVNGWVEISTDRLLVRYKLVSGPFAPDNLRVTWTDGGTSKHWQPGSTDDKNLGGVPGDIADERVGIGNEPGPLSRNGYFLLDDSHTAVWNAAKQWPEPRPVRDGQDWYFFQYGTDYKALFREATQLLGPVPMIPKYMLGTWFGSRAPYSGEEWKRIVRQFRDEQIPLDVVVLDSYSTTSVVWSGLDWDHEQVPDAKEFFGWLKAHGVMAANNEHFEPLTPLNAQDDHHFEKIRTALGLPADTKRIPHDLGNQKYAQLYLDLLHKPALDAGLAFWWEDGSAPNTMDGLDMTLWTRHIGYEGAERLTNLRPFVFCRIGTPPWGGVYPENPPPPAWGGHRYGAFFTGDTGPYWSTLTFLTSFNVKSGNMLVPYVNNLTGGVWRESVDPELYQRWVQFSALSPIFWWHGYWGLRLPWEYGTAGANTVRKFLQLRYKLLPYTYTYARIAHDTGLPLVRGTYLEYPNQEPAYQFNQQYLYGQDLLVAPITAPGQGQPVQKAIYFPAEEHWYDYFTGRIYPGGTVVHYECPLDRMPLFVRAGAVIPMAPHADFTSERPNDPLTIAVYAGKSGSFRLYEDDGESRDYRKHEYAWTSIQYTANDHDGQHTIRIAPAEGRYRGQPSARQYRIHVYGLCQPTQVTLGGRTLTKKWADAEGTGWSWDTVGGVTEIVLAEPISVRDTVSVTLHRSGRMTDVLAVQQIRRYRERVRSIKPIQKLRWSMLIGSDGINAQPHALATTTGVEQRLNDLLDHSDGLTAHPVDYIAMSTEILSSLVNEPFKSPRKIPAVDPDMIASQQKIASGTFTEEERWRMTALLLDCRLFTATSTTAQVNRPGAVQLQAWIAYDTTSITPPTVKYDLLFPPVDGPGWTEASRRVNEDGVTVFELGNPIPLARGMHTIMVQATYTWPNAQTVLERPATFVIP